METGCRARSAPSLPCMPASAALASGSLPSCMLQCCSDQANGSLLPQSAVPEAAAGSWLLACIGLAAVPQPMLPL